MSTNHEHIQLSDKQKELLAAVADQTGKPWDEILMHAMETITELINGVEGEAVHPVRGWAKDTVTMAPDFDTPLEDFKEYAE